MLLQPDPEALAEEDSLRDGEGGVYKAAKAKRVLGQLKDIRNRLQIRGARTLLGNIYDQYRYCTENALLSSTPSPRRSTPRPSAGYIPQRIARPFLDFANNAGVRVPASQQQRLIQVGSEVMIGRQQLLF